MLALLRPYVLPRTWGFSFFCISGRALSLASWQFSMSRSFAVIFPGAFAARTGMVFPSWLNVLAKQIYWGSYPPLVSTPSLTGLFTITRSAFFFTLPLKKIFSMTRDRAPLRWFVLLFFPCCQVHEKMMRDASAAASADRHKLTVIVDVIGRVHLSPSVQWSAFFVHIPESRVC
jgi:hypothetical protein